MTADTDQERISTTIVITRKYQGKDKKIGWVAQEVRADGSLDPQERFYGPKLKVRVGCVYTLDVSPDGSSYWPGTAVFQRGWSGPERVGWDLAVRAFDAERDAVRFAKKEEGRNLVQETLEPLRRAYLATNAQQRRAMEVVILTYLRTGDVA